MRRIKITAGHVVLEAECYDTNTANQIWNALPIQARGNTWGDEIYFSIPVHLKEEQAQEVVEMGDLGYWPPGNALCIFFGPTPASKGNDIRPASPVNVWGHVLGEATLLKDVPSGTTVLVEKAKEEKQ